MDPKNTKYCGRNGVEYESVHRARVNGSSLALHIGKPVCLLGTVVKAQVGLTAFQMKASDGKPVNIQCKSPIDQQLTGLVEVYGVGKAKNLVLADGVVTTFSENAAAEFDMTTYNEVVNLVNTKENNPWSPPK